MKQLTEAQREKRRAYMREYKHPGGALRANGRPLSADGVYAKKFLPSIDHAAQRVRRAGGAEKLMKLSPEVQALLLGVAS